MASKGPRSKLDHEARPKRKKAPEASKEPPKPKVHWDHVLGEMLWLSKEFEAERKWKLSMAKKIAQKANLGVVDQATKDEKKQKVLYKNQLEVEEKKKKALDKQLDFLLGQTERYSTMLAENLVDVPHLQRLENGPLQTNLLSHEEVSEPSQANQPFQEEVAEPSRTNQPSQEEVAEPSQTNQPFQEEVAEPSQTNQPSQEEVAEPSQTNQPSQEEVTEENINALTPDDLDKMETDDDYNSSSNEEQEDDERTIDEDEAQITEAERNEELAALQAEADLPLDDLLKMYTKAQDSSKQINGCNNHESGYSSSDEGIDSEEANDRNCYTEFVKKNHGKTNGSFSSVVEQDDEATLSEEEELAKKDDPDPLDEIKLLQKESEIPLEELLARYQKDGYADDETTDLENSPAYSSEDVNTHISPDGRSADNSELNNDTFENDETADMLVTEDVSGNALQLEEIVPEPSVQEEIVPEPGVQEEIVAEPTVQKETVAEPNVHEETVAEPSVHEETVAEPSAHEEIVAEPSVHAEIVPESSVQEEIVNVQENSVKEDELTDAKVTADKETGDSVMADAAAAARSAQPTGNTFSTTSSHQEFKDWFCNPISGMVEGQDKMLKQQLDKQKMRLTIWLLKKLEQEEAADNQEFSEEVAGRLEDDELVNEEDGKPDEHTAEEHKHQSSDVDKDKSIALPMNQLDEEKALTLAVVDGDMDMLADVKQMAAAAAAAGHASSSFENQLRPIDRYAMRFLEFWDPVIDKAAVNYQVNVPEEEWELERIEKLKDDLEAEIDEDQEPLSYETWDVDFATTAYHQHVEALAKKQLEEQEKQALEAAKELEETNEIVSHRKKSKKKRKAGKFKSLKKGRLSSDSEAMLDETSVDTMSIDDNAPSPELMSNESPHQCSNKRKKMTPGNEEVNSGSRSLKRFKKAPKSNGVSESSSHKNSLEGKRLKLKDEVNDSDPKLVRTKNDGRVSIPCMPVKRVMVIKPERLKKKGLLWPRDCALDPWTTEEDAVLCGTVNEYGPVWELASEFLHSMPGGGLYRGRYRHPVHCCERFRELFCKHVLSATDNSNSEKAPSGAGKAILKVSEHQKLVLKGKVLNGHHLLSTYMMPARPKSGTKSAGKHKAASESGRPPKSKTQRTAEPHKALSVTHDFLRAPGRASTSAAEFHITWSLSDFGIDDSEFTYIDDELPLEADTEFAPHQYDPGSLPGIEELDPHADLTDIG
ncbi:hypothetical protein ACQ4PT_066800 [Festuca glaucescens]